MQNECSSIGGPDQGKFGDLILFARQVHSVIYGKTERIEHDRKECLKVKFSL